MCAQPHALLALVLPLPDRASRRASSSLPRVVNKSFPFEQIAAFPDALLFVATDESVYLHRIIAQYGKWAPDASRNRGGEFAKSRRVRRYARGGAGGLGLPSDEKGRVVFYQFGFDSDNVIASSRLTGRAKGESAILDAMLLSKTDFLLKTTSALSEFAIWISPRLHQDHLDLQFDDRFASQKLPSWAAHVGYDGARVYCEALARGCRIDSEKGSLVRSGQRGGRSLLRPGQACMRCRPRLRGGDGLFALPLTSGACGDVHGLRAMTEAECVGFAEGSIKSAVAKRYSYIGASSEAAEPAGCLLWNNRDVEFNTNTAGGPRSCNLRSKGGVCVCADTRESGGGTQSVTRLGKGHT
mmetsp:Transcript_5563/g.15821  ORF Transcript_5563/g.15821 Transcript_5563/m.15821 type:complete len:355 (+) Transcript_5563:375-1439(+)